MKIENIKSYEDVSAYIEGCLNDFEAMVSTKQETELHIHQLIIFLIKMDRVREKRELKEVRDME